MKVRSSDSFRDSRVWRKSPVIDSQLTMDLPVRCAADEAILVVTRQRISAARFGSKGCSPGTSQASPRGISVEHRAVEHIDVAGLEAGEDAVFVTPFVEGLGEAFVKELSEGCAENHSARGEWYRRSGYFPWGDYHRGPAADKG